MFSHIALQRICSSSQPVMILFSLTSIGKAVTHRCDALEYNAAAMLQERMANNYHMKNENESAIQELKRATKLYHAANMQDCADRTLDRAAYLLGKTGKFKDSAHAYESLATIQSNQNLKKFNASENVLRSGLLLLYDCLEKSDDMDLREVKQLVGKMSRLDCRFEESREYDFLIDIVYCVSFGNLDLFADCLYSFNILNEFDELMLVALEGIKNAVIKRAEKRKSDT